MEPGQLSELRQGYVARLERAKAKVLELEDAVRSIDTVMKITHAPRPSSGRTNGAASKLTSTLRTIVQGLEGNFSMPRIAEALKSQSPDLMGSTHAATLSKAVRRMAENNGPLELVESGSGRRPAVYRKRLVAGVDMFE